MLYAFCAMLKRQKDRKRENSQKYYSGYENGSEKYKEAIR